MAEVRWVLVWLVVAVTGGLAATPSEEVTEDSTDEPTEPPPPSGPPLVAMCELVRSQGESCEEYLVSTEDGYLLKLYRVRGPDVEEAASHRPVALLAPGLFCSSEIFAIRNDSIGMRLSSAGVDVWMVNFRGTVHGRNHRTLNPNTDQAFWDASYSDMGKYDLPAAIKKIREVTGREKIHYLGHSLGSTALFVLLCSRPELAAVIESAVLLAPTFYATKYQFLLKEGSSLYTTILEALADFRKKTLWEVFPRADVENSGHQIHCDDLPSMVVAPCKMMYEDTGQSMKGGCSLHHKLTHRFSESLDVQMVKPLVGDYVPAGATEKNLEHYAQTYIKGKIAFFDYGSEEENKRRYGSTTVPDIDLKKATTKMHLLYSESDLFVAPSDVERLAVELPNLGSSNLITDEPFTHMDFVFPTTPGVLNSYNRLVDKIVQLIKE